MSFKVVLSGLSGTLRTALAERFEVADEGEARVLYILGRWQEALADVPQDSARLALCQHIEGEELTEALASGALHGVASAALSIEELVAQAHRAWNCYLQSEIFKAESAQGQRFLNAIASLSSLGAELADFDSRGAILRSISRSACLLGQGSLAAIVLVDRKDPPLLHVHSEQVWSQRRLMQAQGQCIEAYIRLTGRALDDSHVIPDYSGAPFAAELADGSDSAPAFTFEQPLFTGGVTVGVLLVASRDGVPLDPATRAILELTAARTTDALSRLRTRRFEQRRRLGLMVESMADGLIMTELERDEVLINPSARRLLDIDEKTKVTQQYLKERLGFYPFDLVAANPESNELLREELSIGDKRVHSMVSPVRERSGALIGVVVVLRDFTEAHDLAHRQQEFVAIVSHELRSPLTSISGALDIAISDYAGRLNDKQRQYMNLARESCTALNQIVDDLLDVARSESGGMPIHMGPVDLNALTAVAVKQYRASALSKQIELDVKSSAEELRIAGDPDRLTQVLNNLLSNALKFTPVKGRIEVEVFGPSVTSSHVGVSVFNNGDSIAEEAQERIFEKFEQIKNSSTRRVGGSGLGLAISRSIIEAHGGRIWVESNDDGAKFVFTLPAVATDSGHAEAPRSEIDSALLSAPRSGVSVLLIDADRHSSYILKGILMSAGHDVSVAADADAALGEARRRIPPLIVLNASSALDDPLALIEILKHDADTRRSAVLVLSAKEDPVLAEAAGTVLAVPVDPDPFHRECARLIAEAGAEHGSRVLVVDDDSAIRTICCEVLRQAGMTVRDAANGIAALSDAKRFRPDLIILDVMMPDLDGFQTAEHLKADPATAMTPIIFLSALGETSDKVKAFRLGAEDYVVKPFVAAELVARTRKALERSNRELGASPTTQLPGGGAIESEIEQRLGDKEAAFCYLDLDNLKAFNDYYSYAKADSIIRQTGDLVRDVISRVGSAGDFIGHIAGDDFVFITTREHVDDICMALCTAFDRLVPLYYDKGDRDAGYIEAKDRYGDLRRFPLMSVSIAAICGDDESKELNSYSELAAAAAVGKKLAKGILGSAYVRNGKTLYQAQ